LCNELDAPRTAENQLIFDGESFNTSSERIVILHDVDVLDSNNPDEDNFEHAVTKFDLMNLDLLNISLNDGAKEDESSGDGRDEDEQGEDCFTVDVDNFDDYYNEEFDDDHSSCDDSKSVESDSTIPTSEDISVSPSQENFMSGKNCSSQVY